MGRIAYPPPISVQKATCGNVAARRRFRPWLETLEDRITPNSAPIAVADSYQVHQGDSLYISDPGVLANDSDADQDPLTAELVSDVSNGYLFLEEDGGYSYDPDPGFVGSDSFSYWAYDGTDYSNIVTVQISVTNAAPVAAAETYSVHQGESLFVSSPGILGNDSDADQDSLTAELVSDVSDGYLMLNDDGSFDYDPDPGFAGTDSFTYRAYDGAEYSNTVTVTINVTNTAPTGNDDWYVAYEGETLFVSSPGVLENDFDQDADILSAVLESSTGYGDLELNSDGSFDYTPDPFFTGTDSFTYRVSDGAAVSALLTVLLNVQQAPANSVTFTVNTVDDTSDANPGNGSALDANGNVSLRSAIQEGNALAGNAPIIINFATTLGDGTISLATALPNLSKDFTINGEGAPGVDVERASYAGDFRIFFIEHGKTVSLSNFSLLNGRAVGQEGDAGYGGAIFNEGILTLTNMTLSGHYASAGGGAIFNDLNDIGDPARLTLINSTITSNSSIRGGGIYNWGHVSISGSEISYNTGLSQGGGIYNYSLATLNISNTSVSANQAEIRGGGIVNVGGQFTMEGGSIDYNTVTGINGYGGGLFNSSQGTSSLRNVNIKNNQTTGTFGKGGGVYVRGGTVTLRTSTISDNSSGSQGAGSGGSWHRIDGTLNLINPNAPGKDFVPDPDT